MTISAEGSDNALRSELRAARENELRWKEMSPESTADIERIQQWATIAKLRRLEVERIEGLLAKMAGDHTSPQVENV
jgi:hypothetical protein